MNFEDYKSEYQQSISGPENYWNEQAQKISWFKSWQKVKATSFKNPVSIKWYEGGQLNASFNCLDRHVLSHPNKIALIFEPDHPKDISIQVTYKELFKQVCTVTKTLREEGVQKGDRVTIYMPMTIQAVVSLLACARIGAIHSVVFAGFSAEAIADRIKDGKSEWIITSHFGLRGGRVVPLLKTVFEALKKTNSIKKVFLFERENTEKLNWYSQDHFSFLNTLEKLEQEEEKVGAQEPETKYRNQKRAELLAHPKVVQFSSYSSGAPRPYSLSDQHKILFQTDAILIEFKNDPDFVYEPPEICDAEDPLFLLYTSGSTNKPKGVLHTTGGYLVYARHTFEKIFECKSADIFWCTADVGWITGHSYIVYGPLSFGATVLIFEGVPNFPTPARFWEVIDKYAVTIFYTAPTALRSLMRESLDYVRKSSRKSLRLLGSVGEPINPEAWQWYFNQVGDRRCPIVDTWWQTETGGILISPIPSVTPLKPGSATLPFFGIEPVLLSFEGQVIEGPGEGVLAIKDSWPGQMRTVYGDHQRFYQTYFSTYPAYYFTGDGCRRDEDGYYWITGRVDDVLNVSGHRLGTAEIESALVSHIAVAEAAVVGFPHVLKGQGIYAYVTLKKEIPESDLLRKELIQQVRTEISAIATPDQIQWAPQLPKTRSGKIMRRILRKIAEDQSENLGDISTLADPSVVQALIIGHRQLKRELTQ